MRTLRFGLCAALSGCILVVPDGASNLDNLDEASISVPPTLTDLAVQIETGDIVVQVGDTPGIQVNTAWAGDIDDAPRLTVTENGSVASYIWDCRTRCVVDLVVTVPPDLERSTWFVDTGELDFERTVGALVVELDTGDLDVSGHEGDADVRLSAGDIEVADLVGDLVVLRADTGDVDVDCAQSPSTLDVRVGTGQLELDLPAGRYAIDAEAAVGRVSIEDDIVQDPTSAFSVTARVDVGDLRIESNDAP